MKPLKFLYFLTAVALFSCSAGRNTLSRKQQLQEAREPNLGCFVLLNDGTLTSYKTLKMKTGVFITPYLLADGKIKIEGSEVEAYQTNEYFAISQQGDEASHSKIAKECLPGFAVRIARGKLNLYDRICLHSDTGNRDYFIQVGNGSPIYDYSPELMNAVIKYHYEAYNYFNNTQRAKLATKIITATDIFNNEPSFTRK